MADWRVWAAAIAAVLLAAAGLFLARRRSGEARQAAKNPADEGQSARPDPMPASVSPPAALPPRSQRPAGPAAPPPAPVPQSATPTAAAKSARPAPPPAAPRGGDTLAVTLHAQRLSATLLNTALTYELVVTNVGEVAVGPVAVTCDMIGAHASLPAHLQLENSGLDDPSHRIPHLGPGESASISGELRLPLASITPIRRGSAALFVPLARFRLLTWREGRPPVATNRTFVIGETPPTPGAGLKPFRLDLGPRMYSSISQREVTGRA